VEILTLEEAAKMLKISEYTLRRYARRGAVPARKIGGQWRFSKEELLNWFRFSASEAKNPLAGSGRRGPDYDEPLTPEEATASETAWQAYLAGLDKGESLEKARGELLEAERD